MSAVFFNRQLVEDKSEWASSRVVPARLSPFLGKMTENLFWVSLSRAGRKDTERRPERRPSWRASLHPSLREGVREPGCQGQVLSYEDRYSGQSLVKGIRAVPNS